MLRTVRFLTTTLLAFILAGACASPAVPRAEPAPATPAPSTGDLAFVPPTGEVTLADALRAALLGSPSLASTDASARAADARALQARLWPNPELEAEVSEFGGDGGHTGFGAAEFSLGLSQEILLGGKRGHRAAVARAEARLAGWDYEARRLDVLMETTLSFLDVLVAQERLALEARAAEGSAEVARSVGVLADSGKVPRLEEDRAAVTDSLARLRLRRVRNDLESARLALAATWGETGAAFDRAIGDLHALAPLPSREAITALLAGNPDLARYDVEVERAAARLAGAGAEAWPDLTVTGRVSRFEETGEHAFLAGVSFPLPLFDRNQGGRREAAAEAERVRQEQREATVRLARELDGAYRSLVVARDEVDILEVEVLPLARKTFDSAREAFAEGKTGYLEVLDTQRTLFDVEAQLLSDLAAWHRAAAGLERLIGRSLRSVEE